MKVLGTSSYNKNSIFDLNKLTIRNHRDYCKHQNYKINSDFKNYTNIDASWRHPQIVIDSLKNKKYNNFDIIVNTGQRNIVTNFNIKIEDKMMNHFNPNKHKMVLQHWMLDPNFIPIVPYSDHPKGKIKFKHITEPYLIIAAE